MLKVKCIDTKSYNDQKAGTSGLRKKVTVAQQPNYIANFVQSIFNALTPKDYVGKKLAIAGDGRYFNTEAIQIIFSIAAANGVRGCVIAQNGIMSTPAASALIRHLNSKEDICLGGILLTASHNPGGKNHDFGIKFNTKNGGPALEELTEKIYEISKGIKSFKSVTLLEGMPVPIDKIGTIKFGKIEGFSDDFAVEVISPTQVYVDLMKSIFDFEAIKQFLQRKDFHMVFDAMHGASVSSAKEIFGNIFGIPAENLIHCKNLEDFGGLHPDPNLTYAEELVKVMGLNEKSIPAIIPDFGAACDGDADRNMILGKKFFVTPSDSVAILAANYSAIPYFKSGLKGVARSMPTSAALQSVADQLKLQCYETPTGWKFFGNLMDAGKLSICGEESFGTGSDHIREKDGIWAILAWLSVLAMKNKGVEEGKLITVEQIVKEHWAKFGRNYYCRYDYEKLESSDADKVFAQLKSKFKEFEGKAKGNTADVFEYIDPIDKSVSKNQGLRFIYADGSRFVFRLSGTGSEGATIRLYLEKQSKEKIDLKMEEALKDIIKEALEISNIHALTKRTAPSVIT